MEWGTFIGGMIFGGIIVILLVTPTGRQVSGKVGTAAGERIAYHVTPKKK